MAFCFCFLVAVCVVDFVVFAGVGPCECDGLVAVGAVGAGGVSVDGWYW